MEPKKLRFQKFKNLKRKHLFRAFLTFFMLGLIITIVVLASVKNEKIIYKDKPVSVSQTNAREIKSLAQVIAKAQEDKALLEAQQKPENNAKIKALTTLITQLQTTKKTIEDNAQDIERFRLKIKRLEEEKKALNTQLEAANQDKSNSARIRELEAQISQKDTEIKEKNTEISRLQTQKNDIARKAIERNNKEWEKLQTPEAKEVRELKRNIESITKERDEYKQKAARYWGDYTRQLANITDLLQEKAILNDKITELEQKIAEQ